MTSTEVQQQNTTLIQIGGAVPPNHTLPGLTVIAHMSITTLLSTGVNPNVQAHSWGAISMPTPALRLSLWATPEWKRVQPLSRELVPEPKPCVKVSPTISSPNRSASRTSSGSFPNREVTFHVPRASFSSQGSDRQGLRLRLLPSSHCTRPPCPLPWVVSPSEEFKILLLTYKALNDRTPSYLKDIIGRYFPNRALRSQTAG